MINQEKLQQIRDGKVVEAEKHLKTTLAKVKASQDVDFDALVDKFFIPKAKGNTLQINWDLDLNFISDEEASLFLLEVIRKWIWRQKVASLFCHGSYFYKDKSEDEWEFYFYPENCDGCRRGFGIMRKIFEPTEGADPHWQLGDYHFDRRLPFVETESCDGYKISFEELKKFVS